MRILLGVIAILTGVNLFCQIMSNLYVAPPIFGEDDEGGECDE